jgi:hypothetical protein
VRSASITPAENRSRTAFDSNETIGWYRILPASSRVALPSRSSIGLLAGDAHHEPLLVWIATSWRISPLGRDTVQNPRKLLRSYDFQSEMVTEGIGEIFQPPRRLHPVGRSVYVAGTPASVAENS